MSCTRRVAGDFLRRSFVHQGFSPTWPRGGPWKLAYNALPLVQESVEGSVATARSGADIRRRIALVSNRFGEGVAGGAELVLNELGQGLRGRGWEVDVVSSAARDLYTWKNEFPEGESVEDGIRVLRFRADYDRNSRDRRRVGNRIGAGADVPLQDQYRWMNAGVRVPGMYEYLVDHAAEYRAIVLAPYGFWTTFTGAQVAPERTILLPCLHDEPEAYLDIYRPMFEGSRGLWFQTDPELEVARRIFDLPPRVAVIGSAIRFPAAYDAEGFRRRHSLPEEFALFAGRREWGKGWPELVRGLEHANHALPRPLPLVTCGVGELGPLPSGLRVIDVGYLSDQERSDAMAAASVYLQPSAVESFSRTVMEAWLAGTPVVANAASAVVSWHCRRSEGGFVYRDRYELAESLRLLQERPELGRAMAERGRSYVLQNYRWEQVLERVETTLEEWT
jgi:glycosyltransferase involved in cell wall biosynthesis